MSRFHSTSTRTWNVFLGSLAKSIEMNGTMVLCSETSIASSIFPIIDRSSHQHQSIWNFLEDKSLEDAVMFILNVMRKSVVIDGLVAPIPNSQTYCIAAAALQRTVNATFALTMFRNANTQGLVADGRFINAIFRCYGDEIDTAINDWKSEIRPQCVLYESKQNSFYRERKNENMIACYHGLFYVAGRANRPDIALRLVYAMKREGLEATEQALNSYRAGIRIRKSTIITSTVAAKLALKLQLINAYESLLEIECTRYNQNDRRRQGETRVRIIV
jgi:hypothetical protein